MNVTISMSKKNGYNIFIPRENVLYIGREFDLREE